MDVFPKFIIENDILIMMKVTYHNEIRTDENSIIKGGGWFKYQGETIIFHGSSYEFGSAKEEDIINCIRNHKVFEDQYEEFEISNDFKFKYDTGSEIIDLN